MKPLLLATLLVAATVSCSSDKDCCGPLFSVENELAGRWLLYETGYSPGAGYFTNDVAPVPAQTMTFGANGSFSSNVAGFTQFSGFTLEPNSWGTRLLLNKGVGAAPPDEEDGDFSFIIEFEGGNLKVYPMCIEGCHYALSKLDNSAAHFPHAR